MKGLVSAIQHCSVHDGPGIRTTVFLKGCNLRCMWCHNPETIYSKEEILVNPEKCIHCGFCEDGCYSGARELCGTTMTVEQVMADIMLDKPYYGRDGGVTISGGEPFLQYEFLIELLKQCHENGLSCAIETNLSLYGEKLADVISLCDLVMCDIKLWDSKAHRYYTGVDNDAILLNFKVLAELGVPIIVRTPVMQGVNDTIEEIGMITDFLTEFENIRCYELLTYHPLGLSKGYSEHFTPRQFEKPTKARMKLLADIASSKGLSVRLDGICHNQTNKKG